LERSDVSQAMLVATLREGVSGAVERLLRSRSPFPSWTDADRLAAFVTTNEVVFLFEGDESTQQRVGALEDVASWADSPRWAEWVTGRPRVAGPVFWLERGRDLEGVFFTPTPGPGDSDGGDLLLPPFRGPVDRLRRR
jgi:hypothetical protein